MTKANNLPTNKSFIRNGFGQTFKVHYQEDQTILQNHQTGKLSVMSTDIFTKLYRNNNYVTVNNPNSIRELLDTKAIGSRFLIRE